MKLPFAPNIIEHAAFTIGETPSKIAQCKHLLAKAHIQAFRQYNHPIVTVAADIYNIEVEAHGAIVRFYDDHSIPGICMRPSNPQFFGFSPRAGRISMILDAATLVKEEIGNETRVGVGICGPFSIMTELIGYESMIDIAYNSNGNTLTSYLEKLLEHQKGYCNEIAARGLGVTVYESWASPPLVSPDMYRQFAFPYEKALFAHLDSLGITSHALIIGGDTRAIARDMLAAGSTMLLSDYSTPLPLYVEMAKEAGVTLRANIDPKQVQRGDWPQIQARISEIVAQAKIYPNMVIGTGVVPYDTPPEHIFKIIDMIGDCK